MAPTKFKPGDSLSLSPNDEAIYLKTTVKVNNEAGMLP